MLARTAILAGGILLIAASLSFGSTEKRAGVKHGEILCGDSGNAEVVRLDPETGDTHVLSDDDRFVNPSDSALVGKSLYVADYGAFSGLGGVFKVNTKTGETTVASDDDQFVQPDGIAAAPNGKLYVTDLDATGDDGALFRVNPKTGKAKLVASGGAMVDALGVVVPKSGKPIVSSGDAPRIAKVDPKTGHQKTIANAGDGLEAEGGLALSGGKLYSNEGSFLQSVDLKTGKVKKAVDPFESDTYGITADANGRIYAGSGDEVIRAKPGGNAHSVGNDFSFCEGLEYVR
jgi:DNA-binding beta-propeller fold protein YncE